jgi:hypothetical protein
MAVQRRMVWTIAALAVGSIVFVGTSAQATPGQRPGTRGVEARQATVRLAANPGQVADVANASTADGAQAIQGNLSGAPSQLWETEATLNGYYRFKSNGSGKCLNVAGASTADGAPVVQYTCGGDPNELWKPQRRITGYQLVSKNSGKCLNVKGGVGTNNPLVQFTCSTGGAANDVWLVVWEPPFTP